MVTINSTNSIFEMKAYGKIYFYIKGQIDKKKITRNRLAKLADIHFEVSDKRYNGNIERMDVDVLTRICYVLDCDFPI